MDQRYSSSRDFFLSFCESLEAENKDYNAVENNSENLIELKAEPNNNISQNIQNTQREKNSPVQTKPGKFLYTFSVVNEGDEDEKQNNHLCEHCGKAFELEGNLNVHITTHHATKDANIEMNTNRNSCSICNKFGTKTESINHDIKVHDSIIKYNKECDYKTNKNCNLIVHMRTHTDLKPYRCAVCDSKFSRISHLNRHLKAHSEERPFKCTVCNSRFSQKIILQRHLRTHTGEKPYKCSLCDSAFGEKGVLKRHLRTHTKEYPYKCSVCSAKFIESGALKVHIRTHSGEKPYKCIVCDSKFSNSNDLRRHLRTHTGERPYECTVCDSTFTQKSNLQRHLRIHTGERPYKCTVCDSKFGESSKLKIHLKTHTEKNPKHVNQNLTDAIHL